MCGTQFYPVELRSALASHSAGVPAFQVHQHVYYLPGTSCAPYTSSSIALHAEGFTQTCGQGCNIARALMYAKTPLPRPTYPLLDHTPPIEVVTVADMDIIGDIELSQFSTQHHS